MEENTNAAQDINDEKQEEQNEEDYKSKYMYLLAEVDNYKKSKEKELVEYIKYSNERLIIDLLKVLDDFESVLKQDKDEKVQALYKALISVLSHYGLEQMEVLGMDFSSDIAEAVATEESKEEKGKIIEEVQKGYKLNGKIIRYPKVKISV
ncbi:nucleotide exchange factor GrpE [Candidatus Parvarchaeota archaeon]|nr:nucleotide exchange factor GrpE [Candidatus Parvarchaeota archaeon]